MTEEQFQRSVERIARLYRWRTYHTRFALGSNPGFPDLVLVRPPRLVFAELKSDKGNTTPDQDAWLEDLRACRMPVTGAGQSIPEVYVWRPAQLDELATLLR